MNLSIGWNIKSQLYPERGVQFIWKHHLLLSPSLLFMHDVCIFRSRKFTHTKVTVCIQEKAFLRKRYLWRNNSWERTLFTIILDKLFVHTHDYLLLMEFVAPLFSSFESWLERETWFTRDTWRSDFYTIFLGRRGKQVKCYSPGIYFVITWTLLQNLKRWSWEGMKWRLNACLVWSMSKLHLQGFL